MNLKSSIIQGQMTNKSKTTLVTEKLTEVFLALALELYNFSDISRGFLDTSIPVPKLYVPKLRENNWEKSHLFKPWKIIYSLHLYLRTATHKTLLRHCCCFSFFKKTIVTVFICKNLFLLPIWADVSCAISISLIVGF